ncbi:putative transcription factor B3-Domain family [Helianthus anomalus]
MKLFTFFSNIGDQTIEGSDQMDFFIIVNVIELKEDGLVLPRILTNQIPRDCELIKLVDYLGVKYKLSVQNMGHRSRKIHGCEWIRFLESYKHKNIEKLCFKEVKEAKFEVFVLSTEGFEIRKDRSGKDYVHGCLDLPHGLLWLLSKRWLKIDNLHAKVHGPKQSSKVDVCYDFTPENQKGLVGGFMGSVWTTFCFENDIEEGCQLLFQWIGSTP